VIGRNFIVEDGKKISYKNSLPLPKNCQKLNSVVTSMTMFAQSQNPSNLIRI